MRVVSLLGQHRRHWDNAGGKWSPLYCRSKSKGSFCLLVKWADTAFWLFSTIYMYIAIIEAARDTPLGVLWASTLRQHWASNGPTSAGIRDISDSSASSVSSQRTRGIYPMLFQCWANLACLLLRPDLHCGKKLMCCRTSTQDSRASFIFSEMCFSFFHSHTTTWNTIDLDWLSCEIIMMGIILFVVKYWYWYIELCFSTQIQTR